MNIHLKKALVGNYPLLGAGKCLISACALVFI